MEKDLTKYQHCCEFRCLCDEEPENCKVNKRNKQKAEFKEARERLLIAIKEPIENAIEACKRLAERISKL